MFADLAASAAAHATTTIGMVRTATVVPTPPPGTNQPLPGLNLDKGKVPEGVIGPFTNIVVTVAFVVGCISIIGALVLAIGMFVFGRKWGGRLAGALVVGAICVAPAAFFGTVGSIIASIAG